MTNCKWQWMAGMAVLSLVAWPGLSGAVDGGTPQEPAPTEQEIGSRATPMLKQGLQSPLQMSGAIATLPPSPYPPACAKLLPNTRVIPQPIPSTHYFATMPSTIDVRGAVRRAFDDVVQFMTNDFFSYVMGVWRNQTGIALNRPTYHGINSMNASYIGASVPESESPLQTELIGDIPVQLPHGATIREISVGVRDNSGKQNVRVALQGYLGNGQGYLDFELESDCLGAGTYAKMGANNLAIPVDGRQGHFLRLELVPAKTPVATPPGSVPAVYVDLITIGYTMP